MEWLLLGVLIGFPVVLFASLGVYAYVDAPNYGMNPVKWALVSTFVPFFGFFAYLFERSERTPDSRREEMFVDGPFEIHRSKADDTPFGPNERRNDESDGSEESDSGDGAGVD